MGVESAVDLARDGLRLCLLVCGPVLLVALVTSLVSGILQTATQVHEHTLSFVPKLLAVAVTIAVLLPWLIAKLSAYTHELIANIPHRL